ncbi:response regulator transcription factor [Luteolibacter yonseiensis]|uniref:Response regulator transcription factor n=1 Tax=Luteolibacter yonseiensis TaxID=1144680 RepID=A0A934QXW6_9BACT|nr:response regulator transcription factor [Luteolibacter yonseiensis]MBK1814728.1 response regulator transcription factor [Luteolibacter yonseiensis]
MTILIAEDDPVTREAVKELLEADGHHVIAAKNGLEAIATWKSQRPDIVLLDIMMPGASGYEVCRAIRSGDRRTPVVFLSAKSEEVDVVLGLELGADDFLRKPFGKHELLARVRAVLRRLEEPAAGEMMAFGPWRIHPKRLVAEKDGIRIELTVREVKVIQILTRRRGEVVSRDELLNACWGLEYYPESRTLDQHILNLRKKIEDDPSRPVLIETVRGAGYRFP